MNFTRTILGGATVAALALAGAVSPTLAAPENLALGKTATQVSTGWYAPASRANDGITDGVFDNGSVSHTNYATNPWWQVDLGEEFALSNVNVWNRSDRDPCQKGACYESLKDFWVVASREELPSNFDPNGPLADGVKALKVNGVGGFPSSVDFGGFQARHVRVILPGPYTQLALAEVEVFGEKIVNGEAPHISPISIESDDMDKVEIAGDDQFRTITAPEGTTLNLAADVTGDPAPDLQWQIKEKGLDQWVNLDGDTGRATSIKVTPSTDGAQIRLLAENSAGTVESGIVELKLKAAEPAPNPGPNPNPGPTITLEKSTAKIGESIEIVGTGFTAGHEISAVLHSDPITIGTALADERGVVRFSYTIPATTPIGSHEIILTDAATGVSVKVPFLIEAATTKEAATAKSRGLAKTGADVAGLMALAALFAATGAVVSTRAKRRS
ncbi:galactose-binding domain-containing protein [Schaalia turicensis]|uniref:galactose-binding domain-containing protein n=1 Tax=Schaalia turicensis TaxID=131111 RepID=UPI001C5EDC0E|nr:hypothetical protein [Schaalia turicensis]QYB15678.1 hypothetical protein G5S47_01605 [Schaalia turicensis]